MDLLIENIFYLLIIYYNQKIVNKSAYLLYMKQIKIYLRFLDSFIKRQFWFKQLLVDFPLMPTSWKIFRSFLKKEPRFKNLSRSQQLGVLLLAVQYKKTVIFTMKKRVNDILRNNI